MSAPTFFFGAMSPYSWFAAERIGKLLPEAQWRPVFAGALFRAAGRSTWGLDGRRAAGIADCEARAAAHGLSPTCWPEPWPTSDVLVARAMSYAESQGLLKPFALAAMRLAFREGGELGQLSAVQNAAKRARMSAHQLARAVQTPEIKDAVRANNNQRSHWASSVFRRSWSRMSRSGATTGWTTRPARTSARSKGAGAAAQGSGKMLPWADRMPIGVWLFGEPPSRDASSVERLRWMRRFYVRPLPFIVVVYVLVIVWVATTWAYIALAVAALAWFEGVVALSLRIRRESRRRRQ